MRTHLIFPFRTSYSNRPHTFARFLRQKYLRNLILKFLYFRPFYDLQQLCQTEHNIIIGDICSVVVFLLVRFPQGHQVIVLLYLRDYLWSILEEILGSAFCTGGCECKFERGSVYFVTVNPGEFVEVVEVSHPCVQLSTGKNGLDFFG